MTEQTHDFNAYITSLFAPEDDALALGREETKRAGIPQINVSPSEG